MYTEACKNFIAEHSTVSGRDPAASEAEVVIKKEKGRLPPLFVLPISRLEVKADFALEGSSEGGSVLSGLGQDLTETVAGRIQKAASRIGQALAPKSLHKIPTAAGV